MYRDPSFSSFWVLGLKVCAMISWLRWLISCSFHTLILKQALFVISQAKYHHRSYLIDKRFVTTFDLKKWVHHDGKARWWLDLCRYLTYSFSLFYNAGLEAEIFGQKEKLANKSQEIYPGTIFQWGLRLKWYISY